MSHRSSSHLRSGGGYAEGDESIDDSDDNHNNSNHNDIDKDIDKDSDKDKDKDDDKEKDDDNDNDNDEDSDSNEGVEEWDEEDPSSNRNDPGDQIKDEPDIVVELTPEQQAIRERYMTDMHRRVKALSEQRYHLPGNNWKQDLRQYFANNHPLFGIFFHYPEHPVGWGMRSLCFIASVVMGLVMTNLFWLWARESDRNSTLFTMRTNGIPGSNYTSYIIDTNEDNDVQVTKDMILLWTVGGLIHGYFDNLVWTLSICACCDPGGRFESLHKYKRFGVGLLAFFILIVMALATLSVVVRGVMEADAAQEEANQEELKSAGIFDESIDLSSSTKENYEFMMSYAVEMCLALFIWFPLTGIVLFWGVLGCFRFPIVGGRAYEMLEEERELQELYENPEKESLKLDKEDSVWGFRQKDENGNYEEEKPLKCCCCPRRGVDTETGTTNGSSFRSKSINNDKQERYNEYDNNDNDRVANITSRNVAELKWKSYPTVEKKNKKEQAGRAAAPIPEMQSKEVSDIKWNDYPSVSRKNRSEKVMPSDGDDKKKKKKKSKSKKSSSSSTSDKKKKKSSRT